ncbi:Putative cytosolic protein (plasmid) [Borrelia miyamotoi FR64b]|nr:Putative cytosolic protein [Borrelia miyamotoi FR64b]
MFHLFSIRDCNDKFLGMFYGFRRLKKPIFFKYEDDDTKVIETIPIYKAYYIEFRFKKGSVFCYIKAIHALTKKEKLEKNYAQNLLERILNLENELYKFYNKKLLKEGMVIKWMKKNQK